jgi:hypothetical protein
MVHKSLGFRCHSIEVDVGGGGVYPRETLLIQVEECSEQELEKSNMRVCYEIESWVRGGS